jgi:hypothetical protein
MYLQRLQRDRPEQVDRQPGGMQIGVVDCALDRATE